MLHGHLLCDRRLNEGLALRDLSNRAYQLLRCATLRQISEGASLHDARGMDRILVRGKDQNAGARVFRDNAHQRVETADAWHGNVHHDDVWLHLGIHPARVLAASGLGDHFDIFRAVQEQRKSHAHDGMVVHQHDS